LRGFCLQITHSFPLVCQGYLLPFTEYWQDGKCLSSPAMNPKQNYSNANEQSWDSRCSLQASLTFWCFKKLYHHNAYYSPGTYAKMKARMKCSTWGKQIHGMKCDHHYGLWILLETCSNSIKKSPSWEANSLSAKVHFNIIIPSTPKCPK
jgi:hypothetical protein